MQTSEIKFDLENSSATDDVMVVLVPARLRRAGLLNNRYLKPTSFKAETGDTVINVTAENPAGSLSEFNEYSSQIDGIVVEGVCVTTDNFTQSTLSFVTKTYAPFVAATTANIDTTAAPIVGQSAMLHTFKQPFVSGPMKSLEMKLLKGEKVTVVLRVQIPVASQADSGSAVLPPQ